MAIAPDVTEPGRFVIGFRQVAIDLSARTHIVGVLNVTPDSFYDGGRYLTLEKAMARAMELEAQGADIIDIGGESARPGAEPIPATEEIGRVMPAIERLVGVLSCPISIDTTKAEVAHAALSAGAEIVNDISGLRFDPGVAEVAADFGAALVLGHIRGRPRDMQINPIYHSLMDEISAELAESLNRALGAGVKEDRTIIDPGLGFGKTVAHNLTILKELGRLGELGRPIMVGPSRKSFISKVLGLGPDDSLEGTLGAAAIAVMNGAHLIRVHDVAQAKRTVAVVDSLKKAAS